MRFLPDIENEVFARSQKLIISRKKLVIVMQTPIVSKSLSVASPMRVSFRPNEKEFKFLSLPVFSPLV